NPGLSGGASHHSDPINFNWNTFQAGFDSISPTISSIWVGSNSLPQNSQLTINWRAADNPGGSGLDHFGLFLEQNGVAFNTYGYVPGLDASEQDGRLLHGAAIRDANAISYNFTIPANLPTGSNYRIKLVAVDGAGNHSMYAYSNVFTVTAQVG